MSSDNVTITTDTHPLPKHMHACTYSFSFKHILTIKTTEKAAELLFWHFLLNQLTSPKLLRVIRRDSTEGTTKQINTQNMLQQSAIRRIIMIMLIIIIIPIYCASAGCSAIEKTTADCNIQVLASGGFRLGVGGCPPKSFPAPKFLIGSIVISLSRCCLPNDEGPGPQILFPRTATGAGLPMAKNL